MKITLGSFSSTPKLKKKINVSNKYSFLLFSRFGQVILTKIKKGISKHFF